MTTICLILAAVLMLGVSAWLMTSGVMMVLGALQFGARAAAWVGVACLLAGGLVGYAAMVVAPINVDIRVMQ